MDRDTTLLAPTLPADCGTALDVTDLRHRDVPALARLMVEYEIELGMATDWELRRSWQGYTRRAAGYRGDERETQA